MDERDDDMLDAIAGLSRQIEALKAHHPNGAALLDIQQQLGLVQGSMNLLLEDRGRAAEQRQRMFDRQDELKERILGIEALKPRVEKLESVTETIVRDHTLVLGGAKVMGWVGRAGHVAIGAVIAAMMWIIDRFLLGRPMH